MNTSNVRFLVEKSREHTAKALPTTTCSEGDLAHRMPTEATQILLPPIIPAQSTAQDEINAHETIRCAASGVRRLLTLDEAAFWAQTETSDLENFLETFLRFTPRRLGLKASDGTHDSTAAAEALRRRTLLLLLRLATPPSAAVVPAEQWKQKAIRRFFTAPRLMDAHALYGFSDGTLCAKIAASILHAQPSLLAQLRAALAEAALAIASVCGYGSADDAGALPRLSKLSSADDVRELSTWLLDAAGTLHAVLLRAPRHLLRGDPNMESVTDALQSLSLQRAEEEGGAAATEAAAAAARTTKEAAAAAA